jgi:purine nucleosidase
MPPLPRKLILDIDPGIDDAVSLAIALFDPRLDVLAVTATGGSVPPHRATANVQALVALLDPPRLPRLGAAPTDVAPIDSPWNLHGEDGLGGLDLPRVQLHGEHPSEKVIAETLRAHPREVTILALGPLTNIARVLRRDPALAEIVAGIIVCGGSASATGNVTPVADFNFHADPAAARHVLLEPVAKTLVPIDTAAQVVLGFELLDQLPDLFSRAGKLFRRILPHAFRAQRQLLGSEGICLPEVVALVAATNPELFERSSVAADVETEGRLTAGMLVVDRRQTRRGMPNVELLTACDVAAVKDCILRGMAAAGTATE